MSDRTPSTLSYLDQMDQAGNEIEERTRNEWGSNPEQDNWVMLIVKAGKTTRTRLIYRDRGNRKDRHRVRLHLYDMLHYTFWKVWRIPYPLGPIGYVGIGMILGILLCVGAHFS